MADKDLWSYWLEDYPQTLYAGMYPTTTPSMKNYWGGQYGNVWQDYQGKLAKMALQGNPPNLNFNDFLSGYPFSQFWNQLSPSGRGENRSLYPSYNWRI